MAPSSSPLPAPPSSPPVSTIASSSAHLISQSTGTTATAMDIDHGGHHAPPSPPVPPLSSAISTIAGSLAPPLTDASSLGGIGGGGTEGGTRAGDAPSRGETSTAGIKLKPKARLHVSVLQPHWAG